MGIPGASKRYQSRLIYVFATTKKKKRGCSNIVYSDVARIHRDAVICFLRELMKQSEKVLQSLSIRSKELQAVLQEIFDKVIQVCGDGRAHFLRERPVVKPKRDPLHLSLYRFSSTKPYTNTNKELRHLEGKATAALTLRSDPPAASSPPPQSELGQEEEHPTDVALSETTVLKAVDDVPDVPTAIPHSPLPLLEPKVEVLPLEDSGTESVELAADPLSPSSLFTSGEETTRDDTVAEVQAHATTALSVPLSPVTPAELKASEVIDEMSLPELAVPLPPPPAAETARKPPSMKNDKALILNDNKFHHRTPPFDHLHEERNEVVEKERLPNAPTDSADSAPVTRDEES